MENETLVTIEAIVNEDQRLDTDQLLEYLAQYLRKSPAIDDVLEIRFETRTY